MEKIINGKKIADKILAKVALKVKALKKRGIVPKLAVIWVGNDRPSKIYVKNKQAMAEKMGIAFRLYKLPAKTTQTALVKKIGQIQKDKKLSGLIIQLPLPKHFNTEKVLNAVKPEIDVDCLTQKNIAQMAKKGHILPPTPAAVLETIQALKINLKAKKTVLVGYGRLVGKPLAIILKSMGIKPKICTRKTKNLKKQCLWGDVIITGVGKRNLITGDMVKKGVIVIDAGTSFDKNGKMHGDVDFKNVKEKAKWITPVPGGIGPITVAKLLENVTRICELHANVANYANGVIREFA